MSKSGKVIIPGRFSYFNGWEAKSINNSDPKFSVSIIIPKEDVKTVTAIKKAIEDVQVKKTSENKI